MNQGPRKTGKGVSISGVVVSLYIDTPVPFHGVNQICGAAVTVRKEFELRRRHHGRLNLPRARSKATTDP